MVPLELLANLGTMGNFVTLVLNQQKTVKSSKIDGEFNDNHNVFSNLIKRFISICRQSWILSKNENKYQ